MLCRYDIGVMAGAKLKIRKYFDLSDSEIELLVGILNFVSAFGGLVSGKVADYLGRKKAVAIASMVFLAGAILMAFAQSYAMLMAGRVVTGIGVGTGLTIAPLYTAELSPKKIRGALVSFTEVSINIGILLGFLAGWAFAQLPLEYGWRWMLGVGGIPPIIIIASLVLMPESPRWLTKNNRSHEAVMVLLKTCPPTEAFDTLLELEEQVKVPTGMTCSLRDMFCPDPTLRRLLIAGLGAALFQQASGIEALVYYVPEVLEAAGITDEEEQLLANAGVGAIKVMFIFIAMAFTDKAGRKTLLIASSIGMMLSDGLVALSFILGNLAPMTITGKPTPRIITVGLACICSYMALFSVGWGPMCWVIVSEMFPLKVRGMAAGAGTFINRIVSGTIAMSYLSMSKALTEEGTFFLFAAVNVAAIFFVIFLVPETKGKSLEEIEASIAGKKTTSVQCCRRRARVAYDTFDRSEVYATSAPAASLYQDIPIRNGRDGSESSV
ncbi:uncharacterized protein MONBRDRAFT_16319 [Monosiga brevicollis MX1]|uniref:Major facilitator superfamily (MFS) profile domain-containing protein n=1 Tax=Monosiga brevicollis TaxID=81824 RepID=A9UWP5_MONBE|nr:uncharacterized protein MONBRDRAFT_16319 [Monosiga brevicollis MX1]EDQ90249.1 predicted protein [Monosiga brevicollis MX1]|eukprot:XP_001745016.1 hypothetical protein [Monosiga brevicollis MX1]